VQCKASSKQRCIVNCSRIVIVNVLLNVNVEMGSARDQQF